MKPYEDRELEQRLRSARPDLDADARRRVRARATAMRAARNAPAGLRARLAIVAMLVFGFAFSGAGVGLALDGSDAPNRTAAASQYGGVGGFHESGGGGKGSIGCPGRSARAARAGLPSCPSGHGPGADNAGQTVRQVQVQGNTAPNQLPFTGFAAIPVLMLGLGLLAGGLVLRRRTALPAER